MSHVKKWTNIIRSGGWLSILTCTRTCNLKTISYKKKQWRPPVPVIHTGPHIFVLKYISGRATAIVPAAVPLSYLYSMHICCRIIITALLVSYPYPQYTYVCVTKKSSNGHTHTKGLCALVLYFFSVTITHLYLPSKRNHDTTHSHRHTPHYLKSVEFWCLSVKKQI
jgi:hypothetical protein